MAFSTFFLIVPPLAQETTLCGFKAVAHIDSKSKVNCRQPPRNHVLPPSGKSDLLKYKKSGLFEHSTGGSDNYCSNLT